MLGGLLDLPFVSNILNCQLNDKELAFSGETDTDIYEGRVKYPCILSFTKADFSVRYPRTEVLGQRF